MTTFLLQLTAHNMYFQHDCAPAHNAGVAAALLNEQYPECWIGTNGLTRLQHDPLILPPLIFTLGFKKCFYDMHPPQSLEELICLCNHR